MRTERDWKKDISSCNQYPEIDRQEMFEQTFQTLQSGRCWVLTAHKFDKECHRNIPSLHLFAQTYVKYSLWSKLHKNFIGKFFINTQPFHTV